MTVNGHPLAVIAAATVAVIAGAFLVILTVLCGVTNRLTVREIIVGGITLLVGVVAVLVLRRERQHGGRQS